MTSGNPVYDIVISNGRVMDPESGLDDLRNAGTRRPHADPLSQDWGSVWSAKTLISTHKLKSVRRYEARLIAGPLFLLFPVL